MSDLSNAGTVPFEYRSPSLGEALTTMPDGIDLHRGADPARHDAMDAVAGPGKPPAEVHRLGADITVRSIAQFNEFDAPGRAPHRATRESFEERLALLLSDRLDKLPATTAPETATGEKTRDTSALVLGSTFGVGALALTACAGLSVVALPTLALLPVVVPLALVAAGSLLLARTYIGARAKADEQGEQVQQAQPVEQWVADIKSLSDDHECLQAWVFQSRRTATQAPGARAFDPALTERFLKACPYFLHFAAASVERVDELLSQGRDVHAMLQTLVECAEDCAHFDEAKFNDYTAFLDKRLAEGAGPIVVSADSPIDLMPPATTADTVETLVLMEQYAREGMKLIDLQRALINRSAYTFSRTGAAAAS